MFDTIDEVERYYAQEDAHRCEVIYKEFDQNVKGETLEMFYNAEGFGEVAFCWNWWLLVKSMPDTFSFLEIGVYKGRILALVQRFATLQHKHVNIVGLTPLSTMGDKYCTYDDVDYLKAIKKNYNIMGATFHNTEIIKGLSTCENARKDAFCRGPFDIVYIDGCHDYDIVCADIDVYTKMLRNNGFLVLDDASLFINNSFGIFHGHLDVAIAIKDKIENRNDLKHLFAVGHNRVWKLINQ